MSADIQLKPAEKQTVLDLLKKHCDFSKQKIWVFGSRASGNPRNDSDLDLLFDPPLSLTVRAKLQEEFEQSSLTFEVDLVNREDLAEVYVYGIERAKVELR